MRALRRLLAGGAVLLAVGCGAPPAAGSGALTEQLPTAPAVQPVVLDPLLPGWSPVRSVKRAAVYDVPPTWRVFSESTIVGYETEQGERVGASGAADFGAGVCGVPSSSLAVAGIKHVTGTELAPAADSTAREWADIAFRDDRERRPRLTVGQPETITTRSGLQAAVVRVAARAATPTGQCKLRGGVVFAVAATGFTGELGPTAILVVVADTGHPDAVPEAEIRQILGTLRRA